MVGDGRKFKKQNRRHENTKIPSHLEVSKCAQTLLGDMRKAYQGVAHSNGLKEGALNLICDLKIVTFPTLQFDLGGPYPLSY